MIGKYIKWDLTLKCNMRCKHCSVGLKYFSGQIREISFEDKLAIVDKLAVGGVESISFLGGEPLVLQDEFIVLAMRAKMQGIRVTLVSNGWLLTESTIDQLITVGIDTIVVSLDGSCDASYSPLRGKGNFSRVLSNVWSLARACQQNGSKTKLKINTVLNRNNMSDIESLYDLLCDMNISEWSILPLGEVGFAAENAKDLIISAQEQIEVAETLARKHEECRYKCPFILSAQFVSPLVNDYLDTKIGKRLPDPQLCCSAATTLGFVTPDGFLYPCDRVVNDDYLGCKVGNAEIRALDLVASDFFDIWNSDYFKNMFGFILDPKTYQEYEPCNRCRHLLSHQCNPCPLYSLRTQAHIKTCEIAADYLGSIESHYILGEHSNILSDINKTIDNYRDSALKTEIDVSGIVTIPEGIRWFINDTGMHLQNPYNMRYAILEKSGSLLWQMIDSERSVAKIASDFSEAIEEAISQENGGLTVTDAAARTTSAVISFFDNLSKSAFIDIKTR